MTTSLPSAVRSARPPGAAGAIDVDVHAVLPVQLNAVLAYMPRAWREKLEYIGTPPLASSPLHYTYLAGKYVVDPDVPSAALRTPEPVIAGVLEELEQRAAFGQLFATDAVTHAMQSGNPDMAATVAAAFNDFMLDQWLGDQRLRYALAVAPQSPDLAVAEIHRHGADPRVSSVWVPSTATKLSHPSLRPVLEAAIEHGLAVVCHPGSGRIAMTPAPYADEGRFNAPLTAWAELAGLVAHGTFTRLPDLRVAFLDCGFTWLDALLARMGDPDDLIRAHVRIAAAGDGDRGAPEWARLIERPGSVLPDVLVYSGRAPAAIFEGLSEPVRLRVLTENATAVMRI